jgi:hypothetical protein
MNKHIRDCLNCCQEAGLEVIEVEHRGKHISLHTERGQLFAPCTPSDRRWRNNMKAQAKRMVREG